MNQKRLAVSISLTLSVAIVTIALLFDPRQPAFGDPPSATDEPVAGTSTPQDEIAGQDGNDDGVENRWVATVGDTEVGRLDASILNEIFFTGEMVDRTFTDEGGIVRTERACGGFPEIEVTRNSDPVALDEVEEVTLLLNYSDCTIKLSNLYSSTTGVSETSDGHAISPGSDDENSPTVIPGDASLFNDVVPHVFTQHAELEMKLNSDRAWSSGSSQSEPQFNGYRWSSISGQTSEGLSISVTEVHLNRRYNVNTLATPSGGFSAWCDTTNVPLVEIDWFEDACVGGQTTEFGYNRAWNQGWFHAEETDDEGLEAELLGPSDHDIKVVLNGTADDEKYSCIFDPPSVNDYHIKVHWPSGSESYHELAATCSYVSDVY